MVAPAEFVVHVRPVFELDGGVGTRLYGVGDVGHLVALVAGLDGRHVANHLL